MSLIQHDQFVWKKSSTGIGLDRISHLKNGDEILCINKEFFPKFSRIKVDSQKINNWYEILTEHGTVLVSPKTKLFILTDGGKIQFKKAGELLGNYHLKGRYKTDLSSTTPKSTFDRILVFDVFENHPYFLKHSYFWNDRHIPLKSINFTNDTLQISPNRAYVLGVFMASGEIEGVRTLGGRIENILHIKIKGTQGSQSDSQKRIQYLNKLMMLIEENFPRYFHLKIKNDSELIIKDKNYKFINEYLEKNIGTKTNNPVPEAIIHSSFEIKLEYLRGYFDAGFYCEERARYKPFWIGRMVSVLNYEEMFFLTTMLMRLGFRMNINYVTTQKSFRIRLNSLYVGNLIKYYNLFKFYNFKKEWVKKYCDYIEKNGWSYEIAENLFGRLLGYIVAKSSLPGDNSKPYKKLLGNIILYERSRLYPGGRAEFIKDINKKYESKISEDFLSDLEKDKIKITQQRKFVIPQKTVELKLILDELGLLKIFRERPLIFSDVRAVRKITAATNPIEFIRIYVNNNYSPIVNNVVIANVPRYDTQINDAFNE